MGLLSSLSAVLLDCQALILHMAGRKHEQTSVWQGQLHWSFDTNSLSACDVTKTRFSHPQQRRTAKDFALGMMTSLRHWQAPSCALGRTKALLSASRY